MITLENRAGRLGTARFVPPLTVADAQGLAATVRRMITTQPGPVVFCCDLRQIPVLPPDVSEMLTQIMRSDNPRVERNGLIINGSSVLGLQAERMLREAGNPGRKAFRTKPEVLAWLNEVLTPAEQRELARFLDEGD